MRLNQATRDRADALWNLPFNFFKETIVIYKTPQEVYISSDSNFNFFYGEKSPGVEKTYITQSGVFEATIEYIDQEDNQKRNYVPTDNPAVNTEAKVRITVGTGAAAFLNECEKITFDGNNFRVLSDQQPRGMFTRSQINLWLVPAK